MSRHNQYAKAVLEVKEALRRHPWRFILPAFVVTAAALTASLFLPHKYRAEAVFDRRTDMVLAEVMTRGASRNLPDPRQTLVEEVTGQPAIEELIDDLLVESAFDQLGILPDRQALIRRLTRKVTLSYDVATPTLDRVRIVYSDENPRLAQMVVNGLAERFIQRKRTELEGRLRQTAAFFRVEADRHRKRIEELEGKVLAFEIDHAELLPDTPNGLQSTLGEAQQRLADLRQQRETAALKLESLQKTLLSTPVSAPTVTMARNPKLVDLEIKLQELRNKLDTYVNTYKMTDRHPDLLALRQQIVLVEQETAQTPQEIVTQKQQAANPRRSELELLVASTSTEVESLTKQESALAEQIKRLSAQTSQLFPVRSDYRKLTRDMEQTQRQLAFWEDNLRSVQIALTAESGDRGIRLDFSKPCPALTRPVSPDLLQVLAAAIGLGLLTGGLNVFYSHRTDETFSTGEQLGEAFNLPVFGTVSELISTQQQRIRRLRYLLLYPAGALAMIAVLAALAAILYVSLEPPHNPGNDASPKAQWESREPASRHAEAIAAALKE